MTDHDIDPDTEQAIAACVQTLEELEVLLCLAHYAERYSSPATISAETGLPLRPVAAALEAMASRNLLDVRIGEAVLYKVDPASADVRGSVDRTLEAARRNRAAVRKIIRATPRTPPARASE